MGDTRLLLREMTPFQQAGASKHKLRKSYDDFRFEALGQMVQQNCHNAHLQSSDQSIMFTSADLHTVQEYRDKVYGDTLKFARDQELASFNFEKHDLASCAGTIAGLKGGGSAWSISKEIAEAKADVMMTTPNAKRHTGRTSNKCLRRGSGRGSLHGKLNGREGRS